MLESEIVQIQESEVIQRSKQDKSGRQASKRLQKDKKQKNDDNISSEIESHGSGIQAAKRAVKKRRQ